MTATNIARIITGTKHERVVQLFQICDEIFEKNPLLQINPEEELSAFCQRNATKIDLVYIEKPKEKSQVGVEQIEALQNFASTKPILTPFALAIIDDAETLSIAAQNRLLKLIEEPPTYLYVFLLVSNPKELLMTIRSRSHIYEASKIELSSEVAIKALIKSLLDSHSFKDAFKELQAEVEKQPSNQEKLSFLREFAQVLGAAEVIIGYAKAQRLLNLQKNIYRYTSANVNTKLILNYIFLELRSML
jgi:DNA polymerase III gamma/tau subunit